ncbi:MAG: biosynthetic-type acetolactate synthase large subunit [Saccharofermentanales bacterium]
MNGAQTIVKFLQSKNVTEAFGYPGGPVIVLYDAIYEAGFPHILTRHEQGAAHAAEGYAKATGKVGVMIATSGPGSTNLVTGLADAYLDSVPVLAITGAVARSSIGSDAFQEADINGIAQPITKNNYLIMSPEELLPALEEAWNLTTEGRPGPVLVNVPKDILSAQIDPDVIKTSAYRRHRPEKIRTVKHRSDVYDVLLHAAHPMILVGGGVVISEGAPDYLIEFVGKTGLPVAHTLMGKGAFPDYHQKNLGMVGMHGSPQANIALGMCDLILAVGVRFSDRVIGDPANYNKKQRTIIHVDLDPAELGKLVHPTIAIEDDAANFFSHMLEDMPEIDCRKLWGTWFDMLDAKKCKYETVKEMMYETDGKLLPQFLVHQVSQAYKGKNPILVTDVGQHQMFAAQHFKVESPRSFITSGGLGTMGFGLPAAIGAATACPDREVVLFAGDGGFQMTIQELGLLQKLQSNVKVFIMDNACLGMVRQWQELFFNQHYSETTMDNNPDFVKVCEAYGIESIRVKNADEFDSAVARALSFKGPFVVHCILDGNENVYPMIPPGKQNHEMVYPWKD